MHKSTKAGELSLPGFLDVANWLRGDQDRRGRGIGERDTWATVKLLEKLRELSVG